MDDHDPPRARSNRDVLPIRGPAFYRHCGEVMFSFVIDTANIIGPRPATERDREAHAEAWQAFAAVDGADAPAPPKPAAPPVARSRRSAAK